MQLCINCEHCIPFGSNGFCRTSIKKTFLGTRVDVFKGDLIYIIESKDGYKYETYVPENHDLYNYCKSVRGTNETCELYKRKKKPSFSSRIGTVLANIFYDD